MLDEPKGIRRLVANTSMTFARHLGAGLLQLFAAVVIARLLGPQGNGPYAIALLLPNALVMALNLGLGPGNVYFIGSKLVRPLVAIRVTLLLSALLSVLGLAVGAACLGAWSEVLFPGVELAILGLGLLAFPLVLLQQALVSVLQALELFRRLNLILLTQPVVMVALIGGLLTVGAADLPHIIGAYVGASAASLT